MRIGANALRNEYASIAAGGNLAIVGLGGNPKANVTNLAYTLYRTHSFSNVTTAYNGTTRSWSNPSISEQVGQVGGSIVSGGTLTIDVGDLSNLNQGRDAPNVRDGAAMANLNVRGAQAGPTGASASVRGPISVASHGVGRITTTVAQADSGNASNNVGSIGSAATTTGPRVVNAAGGSPDRIAMGTPDTRAPTGSLFTLRPASSHYLVETDPQFADYRSWLGSDYLLRQMGYSADGLQKRLGDGYYEQKLVREQIGQLTGRRFLDGYKDDEAQYQALLDAGATIGKAWNLRPGIALSEAQMAQLTSDIVWLVEQTVTLPDGSTTTALVPQVYLRLRPGDLDSGGALLAGANVDAHASGTLTNTGTIAGRQLVSLEAGRIEHLGGSISGNQVALTSASGIRIQGASVSAVDALSVRAAGNIDVASTVETLQGGGHQEAIKRVAGLYVTGANGSGVLSVVGGGDVTLQAAQVRNAGSDGVTQLVAGHDLTLGAQTLTHSTDATHDARNYQRSSETTHAVSSVQGAGEVVLAAGHDMTLQAAQIGAGKTLALQAGHDLDSQAVVDSRTQSNSSVSKRHSLVTSTHDEHVQGTQLGAGGDIVMRAGNDLTLASTAVASQTGGIALAAGHDVALTATQEQHDSVVDEQTRKKKFLSSKTTTTHDATHDSIAVGSTLEGDSVQIGAGHDIAVVGSSVLAQQDARLVAGHDIAIVSAQDEHSEDHSRRQKKSGFTSSFSGGTASVGYGTSRSSSDNRVESSTQVASAVGAQNGNLLISAGNDLTIGASDVAAGKNLTLAAKDIALLAGQDTVDTQSTQSSKSSMFSVGVTYDPGAAYRSARNSATGNMPNSGTTMGKLSRHAEGETAGVAAATTPVVIQAGSHHANGTQHDSTSTARVSQLSAGGNLTLLASDGSINSQGAQLSAEGNAVLLASQDINLGVAHNTESRSTDSHGKGWSFANNTAGPPIGTDHQTGNGTGQTDTITGTQLSVGGNASLSTTQGDITLTASNIAAQGDVGLHAAGNLTIQSGQDTASNANASANRAIGTVVVSDTERFSGYHTEKHHDDNAQVTQVASTVGSLGGNVSLSAGGTYTQRSSNVAAAQDVDVTAGTIQLLTADNTRASSTRDDTLKIGVFARVKSPLIDLINNVDAARKSDGRLSAVQGMAAAANGYQTASAISSAAGGAGSGALVSVEAGVGYATSTDKDQAHSQSAQGSTIRGGGNVSLTSTSGDLHVVQGTLKAGNTLSLDAAHDLILEAGKSTASEQGKGHNAGVEVGVGASVGAQTGVYVYAQASVGSHSTTADSTTWKNTELSGQQIVLSSKGDTTLRGAVAKADRIDVQSGGDLTIESLQDSSHVESSQSGYGGRVQVSFGTAWQASGYASVARANGDMTGVREQSGLFAGQGGYHVNAGNVNLIGGAITSTDASHSDLTATSLTFSDLHNQMSYSAASGAVSGGVGSSGKPATDADGNPVAVGAGDQARDIKNTVAHNDYGQANSAGMGGSVPLYQHGHDSTTTRATLTEGTLVIGGQRTTAAQTGINTDASQANAALEALPDVRKVLAEQQALGAAAGTVLETGKQVAGDLASNAAAKAAAARGAYLDGLSDAQRDAFAALSPQAQQAQLLNQSPAYRDADATQQHWGTGGDYRRALQAVSAVLVGGVAGQGAGQVAGNALAPYAAQLIGQTFDGNHGSDPNAAMQVLSHALLGAVVAAVNGSAATGGALAGAGGELAAQSLTNALYGHDPRAVDPVTGQFNPNLLPEQDKQMIVALSQAVGALAGGMTGGKMNDALVGSGIAGNAVENNFLGTAQKQRLESLRTKSKADGLTPQEAKELVILDVSDQVSDGLLARYRAGEQLTAADMENLKLYLGAYAAQNGVDAARDLLKNGSASTSGYPYAGLSADERAYADAHFTWKDMLFGHDKSANEQVFADARMKSDLPYINAPNESLTRQIQL
nr:hemagglutinin repeat-containing protein [Xanthomonas oryzae]